MPVNRSIGSIDDSLYAALDLGSNSFHLIVARYGEDELQVLDRYRETVRLARGLADTGQIADSAVKDALRCLERMGQRLRHLSPHNVRVVGTETMREALNSKGFTDAAQAILGHNIEIISGREEARLIHLAVSYDLEDDKTNRLVIDIGGGSTEFIAGAAFRPRIAESLKIGCVSLSDRFFSDGCISKQAMFQSVQAAHQEIEAIAEPLRRHGWNLSIGTSGTIQAVQSTLKNQSNANGLITRDGLQDLHDTVVRFKKASRLSEIGVERDRCSVFPAGLAILKAIFEALELEAMHVSSAALREGLLHDLLGRIHDNDIRQKSVANLVQRFRIDESHGKRVAATAQTLFDLVQQEWDLDSDEDAKLLEWASLLHEIGMNISHASYHKHGAYVLRYLDMPGFSMHEQANLAFLVRTHRRAYVEPEGYVSDRLVKLSILLRIAVVLRRNRTDLPLPPIRIKTKDSTLVLSIAKAWRQEHPLTELDILQEVDFLRSAPIQLKAQFS